MFEKIKKFKHWMRYSPPSALELGEWYTFKKEYEKNAPVRYFIMERFIPFIGYPFLRISWSFINLKDAITYRTSRRYHVVDTKCSPGYMDVDQRMLHACFSLLVDYVEIELAHMHVVFDEEKYKKHLGWRRFIPRFIDVFGLRNIRNPEHGLAHLEWEEKLGDESPHQAEKGKVAKELYIWWTKERPARKTPDYPHEREDSFFAVFNEEWQKENPKKYKEFKKWCKEYTELEDKWYKEDQKMLRKLIDIRHSLWT